MKTTQLVAIMGWGVGADARDALFLPSELIVETTARQTALTAIDGNAICRSEAVGGSTPAAVAQRVIDRCQHSKFVLICFDNSARAPPLRAEVAAKRSKRSGFVVENQAAIAALDPTKKMPYGVTWDELFATPAGKRRAFEVIYEALQRRVITLSTLEDSPIVTISKPGSNDVWVHPYDSQSPFVDALRSQAYGEAEAQLVYCLRSWINTSLLAGTSILSTALHTIDTDIYLQLMGIWPRNVEIVISKLWKCSDNTLHRTQKCAVKHDKADVTKRSRKRKRVWKVHTMNKLMKTFGHGTAIGLSNAQLWLLLAGGVDYCTGIGRYGWTSNACLQNANHCVVKMEKTMCILRLDKLKQRLMQIRKTKRGDANVAEFCNNLARVLYCWRYYLWSPGHAPKGGPEYNADEFEPGSAKTISEWLNTAHKESGIVVAERPQVLCQPAETDAQAWRSHTIYPASKCGVETQSSHG